MSRETLIGPVAYRSRYGFLSPSGEFTITPSFEFLGNFHDGLACFRRDGKFGFIDVHGEVAIDPIFDSERIMGPQFSEGLAAVAVNGKTGYIDHSGRQVLAPAFHLGWNFFEGYSIVQSHGASPSYFVIDKGGDVVSKLMAYEVPHVDDYPRNWAAFGCFFMGSSELLVGFLNRNGDLVFPPKYFGMTDFYEDVAGFTEDSGSGYPLYGFVHKSGEVLRKPEFHNLSNFHEGLARAGRTPREVGFINPEGEWVIEPKFRQALPFSDGLACVTVYEKGKPSKKGFINSRGEMVIEPRFHRQASFENGYAQVEYEGKEAVIDKAGRVIWETKIEDA